MNLRSLIAVLSLSTVSLSILAGLPGATAAAQSETTKEVRKELYRRLAALSPRDAEAHFQLATWCDSQDLGTHRQRLLEKTILIDPDHARAREALGYVRHGLGWRLESESPVRRPVEDSPSPSEVTEVDPSDAPGEGEPSKTRKTAEQLIQEKLAWAKKAEETLGIEFNTYQDRDFIVHSTHRTNSRPFKQLLENLKIARGLNYKVLGLKSSAVAWPDKLQFFYLSQLECESFSELVLSRRFTNLEKFEAIHERAALFHEFPVDDLTRFVGRSLLTRLDGSEAWIGWWLREGAAEFAATQTPEARESKTYEKNFEIVARLIEDDPEAYLLRGILETLEGDRGNARQATASAMTLVDFLARTSRRGLAKVVEELKSTAELPPEAERDSPEFRKFMLQYLTRQEALLEEAFRMNPEKLEARWKLHVTNEARKSRDEEGNAGGDNGRRGRGENGRRERGENNRRRGGNRDR